MPICPSAHLCFSSYFYSPFCPKNFLFQSCTLFSFNEERSSFFIRGGRGGTGGCGVSARVGAGRGSVPLNEENNQDIDKGIGRGDGTNIGVSNHDKGFKAKV